jgi:glycosyltransferase involved in cell wall biosynthesis
VSNEPLVVHVIPTLAPYGAERVAVELAARLPSRGFKTRLLVLFKDGGLHEEVRRRDVRWTLLGSPHISRLQLIQLLRFTLFEQPERRPAIIHTHLFGGDVWSRVAWTIERAIGQRRRHPRPRFISTAHNIDHEDSVSRHLVRGWAMRGMDRVVSISDDVTAYMKRDFNLKPSHVVSIPNGIDFSRTISRGGGPFRDVARIVMVGRLEPQKGQETALRALASVTAPWRLEIIGAGSLERHLKEVCERVGIASRVHFLGERDDVPQQLSGADLCLFPSRWEGMGLAAIEAVAAGVPVLASDLPSLHSVIPKDQRIAIGDVDAWRARIQSALADPAPLVTRAHLLATDVRKRYDVDAMVDAYAELYRRVLGYRHG